MKETLGRTNLVFPPIWLALSVPEGGFVEESPAEFVANAVAAQVPIDFSSQPALWGGCMGGGKDVVLVQQATYQIERATSEDHATDLVQAHLIETLSAVGREYLDFYCLRIRRPLEEYQINGALAAMESAKQEGHLRFLGLHATGHHLAALGLWQFHDAFEIVMAEPTVLDGLASLANQRRVGLVSVGEASPKAACHVAKVRSSQQIRGELS